MKEEVWGYNAAESPSVWVVEWMGQVGSKKGGSWDDPACLPSCVKHSHPALELTSHSPTPMEVASHFTMNYTLISMVKVWVQTNW